MHLSADNLMLDGSLNSFTPKMFLHPACICQSTLEEVVDADHQIACEGTSYKGKVFQCGA